MDNIPHANSVSSLSPDEYWDIQYGPEWLEWIQLTPAERFEASQQLFANFLALGGSLDPEPDPQSPFYDPTAPVSRPVDGGTGLRDIRIRGV
jgi:hypothetical protein